MKAICPVSPEHNRFLTTAHVMQEWVVDESGYFVDVSVECLEFSHGPDSDNVWQCYDCEHEGEYTESGVS